MTPDDFKDWLQACKDTGLFRSDAKAAKALGVHANTIVKYKQFGAPKQTGLACTALFHRLNSWTKGAGG